LRRKRAHPRRDRPGRARRVRVAAPRVNRARPAHVGQGLQSMRACGRCV